MCTCTTPSLSLSLFLSIYLSLCFSSYPSGMYFTQYLSLSFPLTPSKPFENVSSKSLSTQITVFPLSQSSDVH